MFEPIPLGSAPLGTTLYCKIERLKPPHVISRLSSALKRTFATWVAWPSAATVPASWLVHGKCTSLMLPASSPFASTSPRLDLSTV